MKIKIILTILYIFFISIIAKAQHMDMMMMDRPDAYTPIGIMQDHCHGKGQWMFSYRYMNMHMNGNMSGSNSMSTDDIFTEDNVMTIAKSMTMQMHMLDVMYAPSNRITLMAMGSYNEKKMDMALNPDMMMPMATSMRTNGIGDISLSGLFMLIDKHREMLHAIVGVSIPTGSTDKQSGNPANDMLGYPMQMGSGTWDPLIGVAYMGQSDILTWGAQVQYKFRFGHNHYDYRLGNELNSNAWLGVKVDKYLSFSGSLQYLSSGKIDNANPPLMYPAMPMPMPMFSSPYVNSNYSGGNQLNAGIGCNLYIPTGIFKNLHFGAEYDLPVYRYVNGIQMKNTGTFTVGVQYVIGKLSM